VVRRPFGPVIDVAQVMRAYPRPWFVSGGWAIDLFVGRVTREHEDIEVGAFLPHQADLRRHLAAWELRRIRNDAWEPWADGDAIALPEFQVQARSDRLAPRQFDVFFNPLEGHEWVSRRHPNLRVAADAILATSIARDGAPGGMPYLVPEIQLLYKAKHHRSKDEADFEVAVERLSDAQRSWLRETLVIHHPGDRWIGRLRAVEASGTRQRPRSVAYTRPVPARGDANR
jgi:hypothetical protein